MALLAASICVNAMLVSMLLWQHASIFWSSSNDLELRAVAIPRSECTPLPSALLGRFEAHRRLATPVDVDNLYVASDTLPAISSSSQSSCQSLCNSDPKCLVWNYNSESRTCRLRPSFRAHPADLPHENERVHFLLGLPNKHKSGTPAREFVLFRSSGSSLSLHDRTLVVVNWHFPASFDSIALYMTVHQFPLDCDVVHVQPFAHPWTLFNPWSTRGVLSYYSLSIAAASLPGYRGYQFTNDDAVIVYKNAPLAFPNSSWHATNSLQLVAWNKTQTRHWMWFALLSADKSVWNDEERDLAKLPARGDDRLKLAIDLLLPPEVPRDKVFITDGFCDAWYLSASDLALFLVWARVMVSHAVFLEMMVPTFFGLARGVHVKFVFLATENTWRRDWANQLLGRVPTATYVHPCKLTYGRCSQFIVQAINGVPGGEPWGGEKF
jgi:hypothetical protein